MALVHYLMSKLSTEPADIIPLVSLVVCHLYCDELISRSSRRLSRNAPIGTSLPLLILHFLDTNASLLLRDTYAIDHAWSVSHARVDINIFRSELEGKVCQVLSAEVDVW